MCVWKEERERCCLMDFFFVFLINKCCLMDIGRNNYVGVCCFIYVYEGMA